MKRYFIRAVSALCALIVLLGVVLDLSVSERDTKTDVAAERRFTVIIDAGHGGEDCGAIGVTGVYEKDINLSVAFILSDMLRAAGIDVIMTRTEDKLLYKESENIKGQRKLYDLKNRLFFANENPDAVFVSIHMNNFSSSKYSGLQVYYSPNNAESRAVAESIQTTVAQKLQTDNDRQIKRATSDIYILHRATSRAVLVECGFLSNYEECTKLSDKDYQTELSFYIFCGIIKYRNAESRI